MTVRKPRRCTRARAINRAVSHVFHQEDIGPRRLRYAFSRHRGEEYPIPALKIAVFAPIPRTWPVAGKSAAADKFKVRFWTCEPVMFRFDGEKHPLLDALHLVHPAELSMGDLSNTTASPISPEPIPSRS